MVDVTVHAATAAELKPVANSAMIKDRRGRAITIKKLSPLDRMRLFKALGPEGAKNEMLLGYTMLAAAVTSIDGSLEMAPTSEKQIEAMVDRLGDEGLEAIATGYSEHFSAEEKAESNPATIKN